MCQDLDSHPPIPPIAGAAVDGGKVILTARDGTLFSGFGAVPEGHTGAGVVILPDVRGLHPFYEELALRFAEAGIAALAIDYYGRTAGTGRRGDEFDHGQHVTQARYQNLLEDIAVARIELVERSPSRAVFIIGFCFGGRLSFLTATRPELGLSGVIGFYGAVAGPGRGGTPAPLDLSGQFRAPVLGLFGGADQGIPPESIEAFGRSLTVAGVDNELVTYPGAPHSFFDRKAAAFAEASTDAWRRVLEFVGRHTPPS